MIVEQPFQHRHVVTSFICKLEKDTSFKDFRVSIFKRSDQTSTHQRLWSACSGYIEANDKHPLASAWREIEEETGLTCDDLELLHAGKQHCAFAKDLSRRWTIHPFAFVLKPGARAIKLNWENTELRFVEPEEVETYDTVPDLDITLWRTLVGPDTAKGLRELRDDHTSGARSLATKAVRVLLMSVTGTDLDWSSNVKSYWRGFRLVAWHLAVNGRPCMGAAIERAVLRCVGLASHSISKSTTVDEAKQVLVDACMTTLNERWTGRGRVAQQFVNYLSDALPCNEEEEITFLTLSMSCAKLCVLEFARQVKHRRAHIIILESRPCFEGVQMAADLDSKIRAILGEETPQEIDRIRVTLAVDAAVGVVADHVDYVVLGSDRINEHGNVSNKVGSLNAVLAAKVVSHHDVRILAVAETEKISRLGGGLPEMTENHDFTELSNAWPLSNAARESLLTSPCVSIVNPYFEWVPSKYIDYYITEKGLMTKEDVWLESEMAAKEWDEVFEDL